MASTGNPIQKLLDAERQAETIVQRAKENWTKKQKEAQVSAEEDIQRFREHEEEKFKKEYQDLYGGADVNEGLEEQARQEIDLVKAQFKKHRDAAVALLISAVLQTNLTLSENERRQLKQFFAAKQEVAKQN